MGWRRAISLSKSYRSSRAAGSKALPQAKAVLSTPIFLGACVQLGFNVLPFVHTRF